METNSSANPEQNSQVRQDVIILLSILAIICCLSIGISAGGYYVYQQFSENQSISGTATSQYMATKIKQDTAAQATVQAQATATALALQAKASATAQAKLTELAGYRYHDPFSANENDWREDIEDNEYWTGSTSIENGSYTWQVDNVSETFIAWADFAQELTLKDFDVAVQARRSEGLPENMCYGILFRKAADGFDSGAYVFSVCEHGYFAINYYDVDNGWLSIQDWTETTAPIPGDWNLLEISARGANFSLSINHQQVAEFSDERLPEGSVALFIDVYEKEPGAIQFDNFSLQPR